MSTRARQAIALTFIAAAFLVSAAGGPDRILALGDSEAGCPGSTDIPRAEQLAQARAATLCLLNRERTKHGLTPFTVDARLELASQRHSEDMGRRHFYAHNDPAGVDPTARMHAAGIPKVGTMTAENIHWGVDINARPKQIVIDWMNSPGHRANILNASLTHIGIGIAFRPPERVLGDAAVYTTDFLGPTTTAR